VREGKRSFQLDAEGARRLEDRDSPDPEEEEPSLEEAGDGVNSL
jgi:hypothetical protein